MVVRRALEESRLDMLYFVVRPTESPSFYNRYNEPLELLCFVDPRDNRLWFNEYDFDRHYDGRVSLEDRPCISVPWNYQDIVSSFRVISLKMLLWKLRTFYARKVTEAEVFEFYSIAWRFLWSTTYSEATLNEKITYSRRVREDLEDARRHIAMECSTFRKVQHTKLTMFTVICANVETGLLVLYTCKKYSSYPSWISSSNPPLTNEEAAKPDDDYLPSLVSLAFINTLVTCPVQLFISPVFLPTLRRTLCDLYDQMISDSREFMYCICVKNFVNIMSVLHHDCVHNFDSRVRRFDEDAKREELVEKKCPPELEDFAINNRLLFVEFNRRQGQTEMLPSFVHQFDFEEFLLGTELGRHQQITWWDSVRTALYSYNRYHLKKIENLLLHVP